MHSYNGEFDTENNKRLEARIVAIETSMRYLEQTLSVMADDSRFLRRSVWTGMIGLASAILLAVFGVILRSLGKA